MDYAMANYHIMQSPVILTHAALFQKYLQIHTPVTTANHCPNG
jgi:hypothetical protein